VSVGYIAARRAYRVVGAIVNPIGTSRHSGEDMALVTLLGT